LVWGRHEGRFAKGETKSPPAWGGTSSKGRDKETGRKSEAFLPAEREEKKKGFLRPPSGSGGLEKARGE